MSPSTELHPLVLARGHQRQRRVGLALAIPVQITTTRLGSSRSTSSMSHDVLVGDVQEPEPPRRVDATCASSGPRNATTRSFAPRGVHDLLDPVDVAGEAGRHDDARGLLDDALQDRARRSVRSACSPASSALVESDRSRCTPLPLASSARPCRSVGRPSSGVWSILKSPVCRIAPERGVDHHRHAVGDRVRHAQEPHGERADGRRSLSRRHHVEVAPIRDAVLLELALQQRERERRAVDGRWSISSRSRYGSAPMWSSWPCVSTTASTWSACSRT